MSSSLGLLNGDSLSVASALVRLRIVESEHGQNITVVLNAGGGEIEGIDAVKEILTLMAVANGRQMVRVTATLAPSAAPVRREVDWTESALAAV